LDIFQQVEMHISKVMETVPYGHRRTGVGVHAGTPSEIEIGNEDADQGRRTELLPCGVIGFQIDRFGVPLIAIYSLSGT
jgi:hypothetical protein